MNAVSELTAGSVDPRYANQEVGSPVYRVDFWDAENASDEWLIQGAESYAEVQGWAEDHAGQRSFVIYVQAAADSTTILRLHGTEPGSSSP